MNVSEGLMQLEAAIARDLAILNLPAAEWVPEKINADGKRILDALIVGGGMCGATAAFHLRRLGIHNIRIIEAVGAGQEGPWRSFARMETLRSPKHLTGPASGLPNLTFRAWYEAQHGDTGWAALGYIPRETWADYMAWFTRVTSAKTENGVRLETLEPARQSWVAELTEVTSGKREFVEARQVILATGREGLAVPRIPDPFAAFHGDGVWHTGDAPQREIMAGKRVVVIGLGASAFDYAAEALEGGAHNVTILGRSNALARVNKAKQIVYSGFLHGYPLLPDTEKLAILEHIFEHGIAPPRGTVRRVMRHDNIALQLASPVTAIERADDCLQLTTPTGRVPADLVILGTGYSIDLEAAPYLSDLAASIQSWRDVTGNRETASEWQSFPYLGAGFEFMPRGGSSVPELSRLRCFNHAAMLSLGNLANDIPAVSEGADRLARGVAAALYLEDRDIHNARLHRFDDPELFGDEVPGLDSWWPAID